MIEEKILYYYKKYNSFFNLEKNTIEKGYFSHLASLKKGFFHGMKELQEKLKDKVRYNMGKEWLIAKKAKPIWN